MTAKLIYFATRSLDGYVEDAQGKIDFTAQDLRLTMRPP